MKEFLIKYSWILGMMIFLVGIIMSFNTLLNNDSISENQKVALVLSIIINSGIVMFLPILFLSRVASKILK